ncbi:hypothetical protein [Rhodoligotrophos ferricapiens]|uniref:hypothetical protein n=1 Tax=Rhodoligotrophos ferricapiens TaxID=3069264 RepID=UPI00315DC4A8
MLGELVAFLINLFIVEPIQTEFTSRLERLGAPPQVMQELTSCARAAQPVLVDTYSNDPVSGLWTVLSLWTGMTSFDTVLRQEVPACAGALDRARPYLEGLAN